MQHVKGDIHIVLTHGDLQFCLPCGGVVFVCGLFVYFLNHCVYGEIILCDSLVDIHWEDVRDFVLNLSKLECLLMVTELVV